MELFCFERSERDPIVEDNRLTKDLRMKQAPQMGFLGDAEAFGDSASNCSSLFSYGSDGTDSVYHYGEVVTKPDQFKKAPGK